ncbi:MULTISPECIES: SDR family NAD(P)-dependent oxidoreductase [Pseudoalteromonas]|uniref:SDR family NAD(P)-dependent oxidoreductase n=1 Tax=Pseudoalteromonas TaxID=53246 RepID=UPI00029A1C2A|nr:MULTISPECIES: SDR family NAD(P)-dependent oxidoreductase [Pseudoalteromonas]MBR8843597.1 SDR family NAD(P)-dependent oxidoreductase [Pseudoalteromonas sp. JC3]QUI68325.1 SDR family NAD(P)-dependent oxidoreductase [Pseudoalteromonas sp. M8]UDM64033.1 SDR family NAD(P)-dependent oxidoreductase [Pseudoalteromonas piscicida]WJE11535.1 SDR family NAD(P)-dependent oxidoreductase [Pseudoalteromonas sp. JC3]
MSNILITGATSGIGKGLTEFYAKQSHQVTACGRNQEVLDKLESSVGAKSKAFDLTNREEIEDNFKDIDDLDLVILNAGGCEYIDNPNQFDGYLFERVMHINVISIGHCLDVLLPKMKTGGQLCIVSSSSAFLPLPRAEAYGASKAAVSYLARTLTATLKDIDVTLVHPGFVETPLTDKNDFPMPFIVSVDEAVGYISKGIEKRSKEIHFPKRFTLFLKLLRLLPFSLWLPLAKRIARG